MTIDIAKVTAAQVEQGISNALRAGDMPAVVSLLSVLAVKAPARAQLILSAFEVGAAMRPDSSDDEQTMNESTGRAE